MKTILQKVTEFLETAVANDINPEELFGGLVLLLKTQDRDTRHNCADAITTKCERFGVGKWIEVNDAHAACINAQARIE